MPPPHQFILNALFLLFHLIFYELGPVLIWLKEHK